MAAKQCMVRLWDPPPRPENVEVDRDPSGAPWAVVSGHWVPLSLSHAEGWATAASHARLRVGVDVEPLRPVPVEFSRYFLSADESSGLHGWGDPSTATLAAWTVKEAVLKAIGCGLSIPPLAVRLRGIDTDGWVAVTTDKAEVAAACWREDGAVVAVACAGASELPALKRSRGDL
jgi:4'-phosphopantetheinyl transferase